MAKVIGITVLIVEYDIQVDITLTLVTLGDLYLHARLCFCIFRYPLLYQRTGETWYFHITHVARVGRITLSPSAADVDTQ